MSMIDWIHRFWDGGPITLTSRVLTAIGRWAIGSPESMGMPGGFYHLWFERHDLRPDHMDKQATKHALLAMSRFRLQLHDNVAVLGSVIAAVVCAALLIVVGAGHAITTSLQ